VVRVLLVVMLAGVLAAAAVACPLSIAALNHREMPCHQCGNTSNRCPATLCQASSPYLTPQQSTVHKVLLKEMPAEAVNPGFWHSPATPDFIPRNHEPLPGASGRVFLRLHSLLI
jgi:hypothetical protein